MYFALSFNLGMQNRISYYILSLLHLNDSVKIPGIGKLEQHRRPAQKRDGTGLLSPPQTETTFIQQESVRGGLLERYIAYKTNASRTKVRKELVQYVRQVRDTAQDQGTASLEHLGNLSGDAHLTFNRRPELLNPGHTALNASPLPPHLRPNLVPEDPAESASESMTPAFVTSWPDQDRGEHQSENLEIPSETIAPETPIEPEVPHTTVPVTTAAIPEQITAAATIETEPETRKKSRQLWLLPVLGALLIAFCLAAFFLISRDRADVTIAEPDLVHVDESDEVPELIDPYVVPEDTNENAAEVIPDDPGTPATLEDESQELLSDEHPLSRENTAADPEIPPQPVESSDSSLSGTQECIVVVGAFTLTSNADRMMELLRSQGYPVRSIQKGKLAQVGVPVNCVGSDVDDIVAALRSNIEASAWVLRPE
jgi:hypothetical protein